MKMKPSTSATRGSLVARTILALAFLWLAGLATAQAGPVADRVKRDRVVRVCIWPEYYGITFRDPRSDRLSGIDIDLSAAFAQDLGARVEYVDSSFATLIDDVRSERCDVAMFAVGVLPQRRAHLRFTRPYLQSDIFGVATKASRQIRNWADIDKPGVLVGVQSGTFMEPVMAAALTKARMVVIKPPATREQELRAGRIDVFMTDFPYSRRLLDSADWATLIEPPTPFHVLPYAYAVRPGDDEWYQQVDAFVQRIQQDGRLDAAARKYGLTTIVAR